MRTGGVNLHAIARAATGVLHPEIPATLYRSAGQATGADGGVTSLYAPGVAVSVQMQSERADALVHSGRVGMEEVSRALYLFSGPELEGRIAGIVRPLSRNGDMLQLEDGTWWLVEAVTEDFTRSGGGRLPGWVRVRATLQVVPPDGIPQ